MTWTQYAKQLYKLEEGYYPQILSAIKGFVDDYAHILQTQGRAEADKKLHNLIFNNRMDDILRDLYKKVGLWGAQLQYKELKAKASRKASGFGINEQWINEVVKYLNRYALEFVQNITTTTKEDLRRILERGQADNLTIDQIVQQMRTAGILEARARTIARTEIVRAANVGHRVGARSFPYEVNKKWIAANDHRTRHSHRLINGHIVEEEGLFKVQRATGGYDEMNAPGDPQASPGNTINCRCRVTYQPKEDAQGNVIMRTPNQAIVIPMRSVQQTPIEQIAAALKNAIFMGIETK